MDILNEIYQTVDNIVQRRMEQSGLNNQIQAIVLGSSNGKYTISVNGAKYSVKDGVGINPQPNTPVWVCVPNNDWNKAYICAGKGTPTGGSGNVDDVYQNGNSVLGEDHIARINCATPEDIQQLQANFQDGVEAIGNACTRKGSTPASSSLEDTVAAIDAIQTAGNYATLEVNEDGTYVASEDPRGIDAYDIVVVSKDVGQPHTVVFYGPERTIIKTQTNVPYHGYASCTSLDGTTYNGQYFKGWNPSPTDVVRDMVCYPEYGDYIIDPTELDDSWDTICTKRGADYPIGSKKILIVTIPPYSFNFDFSAWNGSAWVDKTASTLNVGSVYVAVEMVKVAEGEDNTTSTWVSEGVINVGTDLLDSKWTGGFGIWATDEVQYSSDWGNSAVRRYLNSYFLTNLPTCLRDTIKQVNKTYLGYTPVPCPTSIWPTCVNKQSLDKIWIPSKKELYSKVKNYSNITTWNGYETEGIDYTSNYMLDCAINGGWYTRSSANYNNRVNGQTIYQYYAGDPTTGSSGLSESNANGRMMFGFCL